MKEKIVNEIYELAFWEEEEGYCLYEFFYDYGFSDFQKKTVKEAFPDCLEMNTDIIDVYWELHEEDGYQLFLHSLTDQELQELKEKMQQCKDKFIHEKSLSH